jgi:EmrB/QacA subfamily drug resistance transporter
MSSPAPEVHAGDKGRGDRRTTAQRGPWAILGVLCLGLFMILLDGTVVNIAIPKIMTAFSTTLANVEWVMNIYVLAFAVTLVTLGRFGDLYGRRLLFAGGLVLFTASSLACGLAPGIYWLIAFRAVQGLGGAAMMPSTLSIIAAVFPAEKRGAAMGLWGGVSGLATAIGPTLGGLIVDSASWRWIFLVNLPIGLIALLLTVRIVPESKNPTAVESLDLPGVALVSSSLFCLTFALVEGQKYGWASATIVGLFVAAAALFALFYARERAERQPLIDFSLFRSVNFFAGNVTGLLLSFGMMGVFFTVPIFLQTVLGHSAIRAGLTMSPMSLAVMVAAPLAGRYSDRIGSKWIVAAGMFLLAFGVAWMSGMLRLPPFAHGLQPTTSLLSLMPPFVLAGLGIGMAVAPVTAAVMATAPRDRIGNASGVLSTMRQIGSVMGIAVLGAVLQNRLSHNIRAGVEALPAMPPQVKQQILGSLNGGGRMSMPETASGATDPQTQQMMAQLAHLFRTWFTDAINTTFVVGVVAALVGAAAALVIRSHVRHRDGAPVVEGVSDATRPAHNAPDQESAARGGSTAVT